MLNSPQRLVWCAPLMVTLFLFTKYTWIGDSRASCHITNNNTVLYDITNNNESIQGSSGIMPGMKKGKLCVKLCQVNVTKQVQILWPLKFCPKAGVNLFFLTYKISKGNRITSDQHNNIVDNTSNGNIILDPWVKTHDAWVTGLKFLYESNDERQYWPLPYPR